MGTTPTNAAFQKITSNNITDDYVQLIRGSDKTVLLWVDALGVIHAPNGIAGVVAGGAPTDIQVNSGGVLYADGGFTYDHTNGTVAVASVDAIYIPAAVSFAAPTVTPAVSGATTWTYLVVAKYQTWIICNSPAGYTSTGTASLSGVDFNTITWLAVPGATSYDIYRLFPVYSTGASGYIGTSTSLMFVDTGLSVIGPSNGNTTSTGIAFPYMSNYSGFTGLQIGSDFNGFPEYYTTDTGDGHHNELGPAFDPGLYYKQYLFATDTIGGLEIITYSPPSPTLNGESALVVAAYNATPNGDVVAISGAGGDIATSGTAGEIVGGAFSAFSVGTNAVTEMSAIIGEFDIEGIATVTDGYGLQIVTPVVINPALFQNVTNYTGVFVDDPWGLSPAGTRPTNVYGIRINAYTTYATSTDVWGLYVDNAQNYMGGTGSTIGLQLTNPTAATSLVNQSSPLLNINGTYWTGSASAVDAWAIQNVLGTGSNPSTTLEIIHSGSSSTPLISTNASISCGVINAGGLASASAISVSNGNGFSSQSTNDANQAIGQSSELLTLSTGSTFTDTGNNLLPAGAIIDAVVIRITQTISGGSTPTTIAIGDSGTPNRFISTGTPLTAGSTAVGLNQIDAGTSSQAAAAKVRVTLDQIPGQGIVRITVFWRQFTAPTS